MKIIGLKTFPVALVAGMITGIIGVTATYAEDGQVETRHQARDKHMIDSAELYQPDMQTAQQWIDKFKADTNDIRNMIDAINRNNSLLADINEKTHQVEIPGIHELYRNDISGMHERHLTGLSEILELTRKTNEEINTLIKGYKKMSAEITEHHKISEMASGNHEQFKIHEFPLADLPVFFGLANLGDQELEDLAEKYRKMMPELTRQLGIVEYLHDRPEQGWLEYLDESNWAACKGQRKNQNKHDFEHRNEHRTFSGSSRHLELEKLSRPVYSEFQVVTFAVNAVTTALDLSFKDLNRQLASASEYFRHPDGWDSFIAFLNDNDMKDSIHDAIQDERLITRAFANDAVVMRRSIDSEGRYNWTVRIPLKVTFESVSAHWKEDMLIEVVVSRDMKRQDHSMNVTIAEFGLVSSFR